MRKVAENTPLGYPDLQELIQNTLGANTISDDASLATPQTGKSIRVVVVDLGVLSDTFPEHEDYRHIFIDGYILKYDNFETETLGEGCLSLSGIHENATCAKRIHVEWYDKSLVEHEEWIDGYLTRVIQYGLDHLRGCVLTDRFSALRKQTINNELKALLQGRVCYYYRVEAPRK